jgi:hypothetical protein
LCNSRPAPLSALRQAESGLADLPAISNQGGKLEVTGPNYTWEYSQSDDTFTLWDSGHHCIVSGKMQPAVIVAPAAEPTLRQCTPGKPSAPRVDGRRVTVAYEGVNGNGRLSVTWRFDEHGIWTEPIVYAASTAHDVVSLHYFSNVKADKPVPTLRATYLGPCQLVVLRLFGGGFSMMNGRIFQPSNLPTTFRCRAEERIRTSDPLVPNQKPMSDVLTYSFVKVCSACCTAFLHGIRERMNPTWTQIQG